MCPKTIAGIAVIIPNITQLKKPSSMMGIDKGRRGKELLLSELFIFLYFT